MKILNDLKCEKCGAKALGVLHKVWLCGPCITEAEKKINNQMKQLILEE